MCASPPGTKACDAVGGAFRPKWREGSRWDDEVWLPQGCRRLGRASLKILNIGGSPIHFVSFFHVSTL
jgi:hypothetical protein